MFSGVTGMHDGKTQAQTYVHTSPGTPTELQGTLSGNHNEMNRQTSKEIPQHLTDTPVIHPLHTPFYMPAIRNPLVAIMEFTQQLPQFYTVEVVPTMHCAS